VSECQYCPVDGRDCAERIEGPAADDAIEHDLF
jgi:hypothetical protein